MALICDNCGRGISYGHAVSHAKNRVKRLFKPNLQKLKVLREGNPHRVKFCTHCIQRLKKDGRMGPYQLIQYIQKEKEIREAIAKIPQLKADIDDKKEKETKQKDSLKIEDIVGKR